VLIKLTVAQLKATLESKGIVFSRALRKADLVDLLLERNKFYAGNAKSVKDEIECTILVLDEHLHCFPFEGLCMLLRATPVTRIPSFQFLLASLLDSIPLHVDAMHTTYVIDPESNLAATSNE
jgi:hypothetical protein